MAQERDPVGSIRTLLQSEFVTPRTRRVLLDRLDAPPRETPSFFTPDEYATLRAVCARLIPQPDRSTLIDLAGPIDQRLAMRRTDGWRYADLPPDADAYRLTLKVLDDACRARASRPFVEADRATQDELLRALQQGDLPAPIDVRRSFQELLTEAAEIYYSHPLAMEEIGYTGFAQGLAVEVNVPEPGAEARRP